MARQFYRQCVKCGKIHDVNKHVRNCDCSPEGLLPFYYPEVNWDNYPDPRYGDSVWRFHEILPLFNMENAIELGIKKIPLIRCHNIARQFGLSEVYVKLDSMQPTETFKDREAFMTLSRLKEMGYRELVGASTGDSGISHCRGAAISRMGLHMFVPNNARERWEELYNRMMSGDGAYDYSYVQIHYSGTTFDEAIANAYAFADKMNLPIEYWFYNQMRIEGMKTLGLEVLEDLGRIPDWYVQGLGSGTGIFSFWKGCTEVFKKSPNFGGIQPAGCAPMVLASRGLVEGTVGKRVVPVLDTYVIGIGIPKIFESYPHLCRIGVTFEDVFEGGKKTELKEFPRLLELFHADGIPKGKAGLESLAALAGVEKLAKKGMIRPDQTVVIGCTGRLRLDVPELQAEMEG
ncbi:MAG: pyridoxal-phosphate dependent enzyme [bacterium]